MSKKKDKLDREYNQLRKTFLDEHPLCQANIPGKCTHKATDVHHLYSGADRTIHYLDVHTWQSVCRACHDWIHTNPEAATDLNLLK